MPAGPLETYVASIDPAAGAQVRALDEQIRAAGPELDVAVKYGILMYTVGGDWKTWVCAVQATKRQVCLRFLYGVLLDDPLGVLRAGSSVLMTWDLAFDETFDADGVRGYVAEAMAKHAEYLATSTEVLARVRRPRP